MLGVQLCFLTSREVLIDTGGVSLVWCIGKRMAQMRCDLTTRQWYYFGMLLISLPASKPLFDASIAEISIKY